MTDTTTSPETNGLGDYMQKVFIWNINMLLVSRGIAQMALCKPLDLKRAAVSAKMTGKSSWTIQDMAAVAVFFNVSVASLIDDTLYRQVMGGEGDDESKGASLVASTFARFLVRPVESEADGLNPLKTKGSGALHLAAAGANSYPLRESDSRCQIESLVS